MPSTKTKLNTADLNNFLQIGLEAIEKAKPIIDKYFNNHGSYDKKSDQSPVTIADREIEKVIIDYITKKFPDHQIIGEESGLNSRTKNDFRWILDPIDGTRYFIKGLDYFSTELALTYRNEVVVGISHNYCKKITLSAIRGGGAWLNQTKRATVTVSKLDEAIISAGSLKHFSTINLLKSLVRLNLNISMLRNLEEWRSYYLFAIGKLDGVIMAKGKPWDFAAASIIFQEAGAKVTDFSNHPLNFSTTKQMTMIACHPKLHSQVIKYLKK